MLYEVGQHPGFSNGFGQDGERDVEHLTQSTDDRAEAHDGAAKRGDRLLRALATDAAIFHAQAHLRWLGHSRKLLRRHATSDATRSACPANTDVELPHLAGRAAARAHSA